MKKLLVLALVPVISLGGCAGELDKIETGWDSLTVSQQVTLAAAVVNGACVITAAGATYAGVVNSIVHPNATTGGSGASAASVITKVGAIDAATCPAFNGVVATLKGASATVSVAQ